MKSSSANNSTRPDRTPIAGLSGCLRWIRFVRLAALFVFLLVANSGICGNGPGLTEYQVKALCLLNFIKYVEWPAEASPGSNSPIRIGILGENRFGNNLNKVVEDKRIAGHEIIIEKITSAEQWKNCQVLFISASEQDRLPEILEQLKTSPILTVGETSQFIGQGGMVNFVKKDGKIRFEINLDATRAAHLQVSSQLLRLADKVIGKP